MSSKYYLTEDSTRWEQVSAEESRWEQKEAAGETRWEKVAADGGSMWEQETFDGFFEQALALAVKLEEKRARAKRLKRESRRKEKSSRGSTMNCR